MSSPSSTLIVFGAQITRWPSKEFLSQLRDFLVQDVRLSSFLQAIKDLPKWWTKLVEFDSRFRDVDGIDSIDELLKWVANGDLLMASDVLPNVLFTPLTVIVQLLLYLRWVRDQSKTGIDQPTQSDSSNRPFDVQGCCTGFLMASALACSQDHDELISRAPIILRLALVIGAAVDLNTVTSQEPRETTCLAIRWKQNVRRENLQEVLSKHPGSYISVITESNSLTLTVPKSQTIAIAHNLSQCGYSVTAIGLQGRFHSSDLKDSRQILFEFCKLYPELQLPDATRLSSSLISNIDGLKITEGVLHEIAIKSLLTEVADWSSTMTTAIERLSTAGKLDVVIAGTVNCVPRALIKEFNLGVIKLAESSISVGSQLEDSFGTPVSNGSFAESSMPSTVTQYSNNAVAVIGMACRFPGADSIQEFWDLIKSGTSMCQELPTERFSTKDLRRSQNNPDVKLFGNFIRNPDTFDHRFFKKSSREAGQMDPQQRLLLEVAYEAMESAGYFGHFEAQADDVGVYVGVCASDYNDNVASHPPTAFSSLGTLRAFLSGKISHYFGWSGPSVTYDTACSSSAVAIDAACKAILTGDCTQAVAGGANVITSANFYQNLKAGGFLSPTGPTKSFDARADGYCRGEGVGLVVLKRLASAIADGDNILGVISGTAVNQNSNAVPITVPFSDSQISLYEKVSKLAGVDPLQVSYVEAHGTGTPVGDPIECESIRRVFGGARRDSVLHLGSVKANIGHTESTSGVAGLIKTLLMLQHKEIPMQANFTSLNPKIEALDADRIEIPLSLQAWDAPFRAACVNNYGAAGSNAAMIVCQAPQALVAVTSQPPQKNYPIYVSAHSAQSLTAYCQQLLENVVKMIETSDERDLLGSLAFSLSRRKNRALSHTFSTTASNLTELRQHLEKKLSEPDASETPAKPKSQPTVLAFGGQVSKTIGLSIELYNSSNRLRYHLNECDGQLLRLGYPSIYPDIFSQDLIEDVVSLHSMLFTVQYSFAKTWIDCGLKVDAVVGHSFGQLTALCVSGSLSLEHGLKLVAGRASLMKAHWGPERGSMISLEASSETVLKIIDMNNTQHKDSCVEIACYNGPRSHVLVGSKEAIDAVEELIAKQKETLGVTGCKRLSVPYGFHSRFTEPLLSGLLDLAGSLQYRKPMLALETCSAEQGWADITPEAVADHTRSPVYFGEAIQRLAERLGPCAWVEAGMNSSVTSMIRRVLDSGAGSRHSFHPINLGTSEVFGTLAKATVGLWNAQRNAHFWLFHSSQSSEYGYTELPTYQFEKSRHWIEWIDYAKAPAVDSTPSLPPIQQRPASFMSIIEQEGSKTKFLFDPQCDEYKLFVQGHRVLAQPLCPAPLYFELVSRAARSLLDDASKALVSLEELEINAPLGLAQDRLLYLDLEIVPGSTGIWDFDFSSQPLGGAEQSSQHHASGTILLQDSETPTLLNEFQRYERLISYDRALALTDDPEVESMQGSLLYKAFAKVVHYDSYYKGVKSIFSRTSEVCGRVKLPPNGNEVFEATMSHPLLIDNFIQVSGLHVNILNECDESDVYVCTKVDRFQPTSAFAEVALEKQSYTIYSSFSRTSEREVVNDIFVFDDKTKALVIYVLGARFTRVAMRSLGKVLASANPGFQPSVPLLSKESNTARAPSQPNNKPRQQSTAKVSTSTSPAPVVKPPRTDPTAGIRHAVRALLARVVDLDEEITDESTPEDLGIDSLMITEVLSEIKQTFGFDIPMDDFVTLTTVKKLEDYVVEESKAESVSSSDTMYDSDSSKDSESETRSTVTPIDTPLGDESVQLTSLLQEHLETDMEITNETNLADAGLDSLICMELVSDIESQFHSRIDATLITNDSTFQDLYNLVFPNRSLPTGKSDVLTKKGKKSKSTVPVSTYDAQDVQPNPATSSLTHVQQHFDNISRDYNTYAEETGFSKFWSTTYPAQARLVAAYTVEAFESFGCPLRTLKAGSKLPNVKVLEKQNLLLAQLYNILADAALIETRGNDKFRTGKSVDTAHASALFEQILHDFPQHASEHKLLNITGSRLADCMTGAADPLMLLFRPAANRALLEDVYTNGPMYEAVTKQLGTYFERAFGQPAKGQVFEILELGGGTGGTTKYLIELLSRLNIPVKYTFTDISSSLVAAARKKFAKRDFMQFKVLDVEKDPPKEHMNRYHAILSTNCIHATSNLLHSGINIRKMLREDGFIALVEFTRNMFWFDLVFGLLDGWWFFKDGREHVLADEFFWERSLRTAGFKHVAWTAGDTEESNTLRIITAFQKPAQVSPRKESGVGDAITEETVLYKQVGSTSLFADIYYPNTSTASNEARPVALMIHGGGFVMLSRKDVRPKQTRMLLDQGFLPVSIDYRLAPEVNIVDGSMSDICDALQWANYTLPTLSNRQRPDVQISNRNVVIVGWSTGGHLAMTLAWTSIARGLPPPTAILAFYCPTDFEDPCWSTPNIPTGSAQAASQPYDLLKGINNQPITSYNVPSTNGSALGGWLAPSDPRSRIILHMNWTDQFVPVLLNGLPSRSRAADPSSPMWKALPQPGSEQVRAISPLAQIRGGKYAVPTFLVHTDADDLIPIAQAQRTFDALIERNVRGSELVVVKGAPHLFDLYKKYDKGETAEAVERAYRWLGEQVGL